MRGRISPGLILGAASVVSVVVVMYLGRGATFSGDEMTWIAAMPDFGLRRVLEPHGGHLILLPQVVYRGMLEVFGLDYAPYRLLAAATVVGTVWLLFAFLRRRVGTWAALAPCLVLLFFGSDHIHLLQGNGFTVVGSIALGLGALLALEREDRKGEAVACCLLTAGVLTYTVALPFVFAALVLLALKGRVRSALWVGGVPLAVYAAWRLWVALEVESNAGGEVTLANALLVPDWIFQSWSGVLNALTGLGYDFSTGGPVGSGEMAGPALAVAGFALLGWRLARGARSPWLWAALALGLVLWASQALVYEGGTGARLPGGDARYLFPGAVALVLIGAEAARGWAPSRAALVALGMVAVSGVATNVMLMRDAGAAYRAVAVDIHAVAAVGSLLRSAQEGRAPAEATRVSAGYAAVLELAGSPFGEFATPLEELPRQPASTRDLVDTVAVAAFGLTLQPSAGGSSCAPVAPGAATELSAGVNFLRAGAADVPVALSRFGEAPGVQLGAVPAGGTVRLELPQDSSPAPWRIHPAAAGLSLCGSASGQPARGGG